MAVASDSVSHTSSAQQLPLLRRILGTRSQLQTHRALWGYLLASPWILGLIIFWGGPIIASFYYSFTSFELIGSPKWLGLDNYVNAFTKDDLFWTSLGRTFTFTGIYVPATIIGALLLAILLNQKLNGTTFYRTIFFVPHLLPAVAIAVVWIYLLAPRLGPINTFLRDIGVQDPPKWLTSRESALYSIAMINIWASMGGNTMLIFLAGLQGVPQELFEAAEIDGASKWAKFRHITLPLLTPTIFFNMVLAIIGALKVFTTAWVATQGGPSYGTYFYALHIYNTAFQYYRLGYGSALAWVLVVILLAFTYFQVNYSRRWVHYESG